MAIISKSHLSVSLILQTLQQLKDVYGDSADKIIQGNTSNIVFLKSTDDSMIETLEKMSGKTHVTTSDSKTVTRDLEKLVNQNEGKISTQFSTTERPVITYNDMAFISERNSIVFRAGDSPIWNRNEMILPMSWRLHLNTIKQPGHEYTFATLPTSSTAKDFDVRMNQPNFEEMLHKRLSQALVAKQVEESYKQAYGYTDDQIQRLDPDDYSDEVMRMINVRVNGYESAEDDPNSPENPDNLKYLIGQDEDDYMDQDDDVDDSIADPNDQASSMLDRAEVNTEQLAANQDAMNEMKNLNVARFAGGTISPIDLVDKGGAVSHQLDQTLIRIYRQYQGDFKQDKDHFQVFKDGSLAGVNGQIFIEAGNKTQQDHDIDELNQAKRDQESLVYENDPGAIDALPRDYTVTDDFYCYLAGLDSWQDLANGRIESEIKRDNEID